MINFKQFAGISPVIKEDEGAGGDIGTTSVDNTQNTANDETQPGSSTSNIDAWTPPIGFISRLQMPQIYSYLYPQFVADLSINNISHDRKSVKKKDLTPSQKEFKQEKVDSIRKSIEDGTYKHQPLLVSSDNVIVDGHHRWHALNENDDCEINHVGMSFDKLYEFLKNKPYAINKPLNEDKQ